MFIENEYLENILKKNPIEKLALTRCAYYVYALV
jgi:hypothetical protein